ncbi:MAG: FAD-dependent oxidoreductase [Pirellulales bacterium]
MRRRDFLLSTAATTGSLLLPSVVRSQQRQHKFDLAILGGSLGSCAAALAALRNGLTVVLTEETDWIGGQLTSQAVPPDEHRWVETHGCTASYRTLRDGIRAFYRRNYPLTAAARANPYLNPGNGAVSRLCHEPRVALAVLEAMLAPYVSTGQLAVLLEHRAVAADVEGDSVRSVQVRDLGGGDVRTLEAPWFIDATELGDLLPLAGTEFITGAEARKDTGELHAQEHAVPTNQQAFTVCFAVDHLAGEDHTIDRPREYEFWRNYVPDLAPPWPGKLLDLTYSQPATLEPRTLGFVPNGQTPEGQLNLFNYRRLIDPANFEPGAYRSGISLVNWPQNDYLLGNLIGIEETEQRQHIDRAKQLSLSLLYWLQTEAPRPDGGTGWPGLRLRGDLLGTDDGLAKYPYVREARRIRSVFTVLEAHVGREMRMQATGKPAGEVTAADFFDSVGIGHYNIDLHPTTAGNNYIDFPALPFQIPLGALIPERMRNLLPACKNIGTTHMTNGCYRLHPVEWNIGEAAGALVAFCHRQHKVPAQVREDRGTLADFQTLLEKQGVELRWPQP